MKVFVTLAALFLVTVGGPIGWNQHKEINSDVGLNISQFLEKYNYPLDAHEVVTEDGYILTLHRIPHGRNNEVKDTAKPAVLFVHCLACSAMDWVWQGPNASLPLLLAEMNYDIWLINARGCSNSIRHQNSSIDESTYWNFSFHEKGYYDMAATIDYILNATGLKQITYVGHSEGTTSGIILMSTRPEYNEKINLMTLFSPIIYINHLTSPIVLLIVKYKSLIKTLLNVFDVHGLPKNPNLNAISLAVCNEYSSLQGFCIFFMSLFAGFDYDQVDKSKLTVFLTNTPEGVSPKEIDHYAQEVESGLFRQFDYGSVIENLVHYNATEPPTYNVSKVTVPLATYYGKNDFLAATQDVERFLNELVGSTVDTYQIDYEYFNHLDFVIAKDIKTLLYDRVIGVIEKINK